MRSSKSRTPVLPISSIGRATVVSRKDRRSLRDILEPDHQDIFRHAASRPLQRADGADPHLVVEGKDRGQLTSGNDPPLEQLLSRGRAAIRPAIAPYQSAGGVVAVDRGDQS
jgi:hypothetical protein